MFAATSLIGVFIALSASFVWGGSDFCGGLATRKNNQYQVLVLTTFAGFLLLIATAFLLKESFPSRTSILWAITAGFMGAIGIASLYKGLSLGNTAVVASTAAVIGTAIPVAFALLTQGWPGTTRMVGFGLAFLGIWLVSRSSDHAQPFSRQGFTLACVAGVGFGLFFILISQVEPGKVVTPLVVSRSTALMVAFILLKLKRLPLPQVIGYPFAWLSGVLDAGGNMLFLLAKQFGNLDVVVVLSSLYPMGTILLARWFLKEKVSRSQWLGIAICLASIGLISAG